MSDVTLKFAFCFSTFLGHHLTPKCEIILGPVSLSTSFGPATENSFSVKLFLSEFCPFFVKTKSVLFVIYQTELDVIGELSVPPKFEYQSTLVL